MPLVCNSHCLALRGGCVTMKRVLNIWNKPGVRYLTGLLGAAATVAKLIQFAFSVEVPAWLRAPLWALIVLCITPFVVNLVAQRESRSRERAYPGGQARQRHQ